MVAWARGRGDRHYDDRKRMIAETGAFLTWALAAERNLPRIPRRRVDQGGFSSVLNRPMAKVIVTHFWAKALEAAGKGD